METSDATRPFCHLWEFEVGERRYGLPHPGYPDDELAAARNMKLGTLIDRGVRELSYTYNMGDNWHHRITAETTGPGEPDTKYPRFIHDARRCPPEDVGGTLSYENLLDILAYPNGEEHAEVIEWLGRVYDPDTLDELITKRRVAAIAVRRAAGKAAYANAGPDRHPRPLDHAYPQPASAAAATPMMRMRIDVPRIVLKSLCSNFETGQWRGGHHAIMARSRRRCRAGPV